ncbi:MAG: hypothetical protein RQ855_03940 [Desulfurococcales archaeon]|nr:hypothetical protein [Desulfurococcales archaeon]
MFVRLISAMSRLPAVRYSAKLAVRYAAMVMMEDTVRDTSARG